MKSRREALFIVSHSRHMPALGITLLIESGGKVVIGAALVTLGLGLSGAMGGVVLGAFGALAWGLSWVPRNALTLERTPTTASLLRAAAPVGATLALFAILTNADLIAAKVLVAPRDAGHYAAANTAGKILIYATWPVWAVLFPALGREGRPSQLNRRRLATGIGATLLIGAPIMILYWMNPGLVTTVLFGVQYSASVRLLLPLGMAMLAYEVAFLSMSYELAVGRVRYLGVAALSVVILLGLLTLIPRTLVGFAHATLAVSVATATVTTGFAFISDGR